MPASCTRRDSTNIGAGAVRSSGLSACATTSGKTAAMSRFDTATSRCSLPRCAAMRRWKRASSYSASSKRTEKVMKRSPCARRPSAAISELSSPPDR